MASTSQFLLLLTLAGAASAQWNTNCDQGRQAIVHLFEWRWVDIAAECERFLAPKGYCGVQISPPNENIVIYNNNGEKRPWWERYQPISYKTYSRSGDERQFNDMVRRCNNVGVRIYVDAVINHMCGAGGGKGNGIGGTYYDAGALQFPGVPYSSSDFNSKTSSPSRCPSNSGDIENYQDANQVRNCRLVSLLDLNQGKQHVRDRIKDWMNGLIKAGVAGFRIDASKHMWPADLEKIYTQLDDLNPTWFTAGSRPFIYQEVIDHGGEAVSASEYFGLGRVTEFNYGREVSNAMRGYMQLKNLKNFGEQWGNIMPEGSAVAFIDNHDNQRGHGGGGNVLTFRESRLYKMAVTFMLAWNYGVPRVMSSYYWQQHWVGNNDVNNWMGPPHDGNYNTLGVPINSDDTCGNGWVCEHRWRQIYNMATFRHQVGWEPVANWWDDGDNQIAFSRGNKGFYAINKSGWKMDVTLNTGMAPGRYCEVISGNISNDKRSCTGRVVDVDGNGRAHIEIAYNADDPMVAFHVGSKLI